MKNVHVEKFAKRDNGNHDKETWPHPSAVRRELKAWSSGARIRISRPEQG